MMGSRGDAPAHDSALAQLTATLSPSQASTVAAVCELFQMLKQSGPLLSAGIADFRTAEKTAKDAAVDLTKSIADYTARMQELAARTAEVDAAVKAVADRETACQDREAEIARKQGTFDVQQTELAARKHELDQRQGILDGDQAEFNAAKLLQVADHDAKLKALSLEAEKKRYETGCELQEMLRKSAAEIADMNAKAASENSAKIAELQEREAKVVAHEASLRSERARLSALLQE